MAFGGWLFLLAIGAILRYAVTDTEVAGIQIDTVGLILMVVAVIGFVLSVVVFLVRRNDAAKGRGPYPPQ
jgi:hypothetical protein